MDFGPKIISNKRVNSILAWGNSVMRQSFLRFSAITIALLGSVSAASAAQFTYTVNGLGSALIDGSFYSGAFTMVGTGENGPDLNPDPSITAFAMDSTTVTFGGTTVSAANPVAFFTNKAVNVGGFVQVLPGFVIQNILGFINPVFATYDPSTEIGPITVSNVGFQSPFLTTTGSLTWQGGFSNVTFTAAAVGTPGAVPEPASWALMIAGFGIAGAALRRKPRVSVSFC
jgi:PEP-CTERM motif